MKYRYWVIVAAVLFAGGAIAGLVTPASMLGFLARDLAALRDLSDMLAGLPSIAVAAIIFAKNAFAVAMSYAFSPLLLLLPLFSLVVNGWLLGWISLAVVQNQSVGLLLAGILPHGIIEIPALIIGEAAALSFGSTLLLSVFREEARARLHSTFRESLRYLLIAIALLVPAAFIEAFVTAALVRGLVAP